MSAEAMLHLLVRSSWLLALACVLAWLARPWLRRLGGAELACAVWWIVPLVLCAALLPRPKVPTVLLAALPRAVLAPTAPVAPAAATREATALVALWGVGVLLFAAIVLVRHRRFVRRLGPLQPSDDPAVFHAADGVGAGPLVLGLLRPRIVLPADFGVRYDAAERALILAHERAHLVRRDVQLSAAATALQALFWFHPLIHAAARSLRFDQELASDARVLRSHAGARRLYAAAMLKTQLCPAAGGLVCAWRRQHPLKERILMLNRDRPSRLHRGVATVMLAFAGGTLAYTAWAAQDVVHGASAEAATERYRVQLRVVVTVTRDRSTATSAIDNTFALPAGSRMQLDMPGAACALELGLTPMSADRVLIDLPFRCEGAEASKPRLVTALGQRASIQTQGNEVRPGFRVEATVTRWPDAEPWPGRPQPVPPQPPEPPR